MRTQDKGAARVGWRPRSADQDVREERGDSGLSKEVLFCPIMLIIAEIYAVIKSLIF